MFRRLSGVYWRGSRSCRPKGRWLSPTMRGRGILLRYTPLRAYISHAWNTPFIERKYGDLKTLFQSCTMPPALAGRELLVISNLGMTFWDTSKILGKPVLGSPIGLVYYIKPDAAHSGVHKRPIP